MRTFLDLDDPLVHTFTVNYLTRCFFLPPLDCGGGFTLSHLSWFFIKLSSVDFGENTLFLARALKASHRDVEWLIFSDTNVWHAFYVSYCVDYFY